MTLEFITLCAILNMMTGQDMINKPTFGALVGGASLIVGADIYTAMFIAVATYGWRVMGTGKGFMAIHGDNMRWEKEHPIVDRIMFAVNKFFILKTDIWRSGDKHVLRTCTGYRRLYGTIWMSLRWTIDALPLMLWFHSAWPLLLVLGGPAYYIGGVIKRAVDKQIGAITGEGQVGAVLGFVLVMLIEGMV